MNTDLTFITNEPEASLLNRFKVLIKDARFFDSLVGYFYISGFYKEVVNNFAVSDSYHTTLLTREI